MKVTINCDMGESFGIYQLGDDASLMPLIDLANIACGFHGSDPNHMAKTVELACRHDVRIGAHPSLPDLQGFGRREMKIPRAELANIIIYQVGALNGFLQKEGLSLNHIKPHGALAGMAFKDPEIAHTICDVADIFQVPILGLPGTVEEDVIRQRGHPFIAEFYADLEYDDKGLLIITQKHAPVDPALAAKRVEKAVTKGKMDSVSGKEISVYVNSVCVHSDTPNAVEVATAVRDVLNRLQKPS